MALVFPPIRDGTPVWLYAAGNHSRAQNKYCGELIHMYDPDNSITAQSQKEQSDYSAREIKGDSEENVISGEVR